MIRTLAGNVCPQPINGPPTDCVGRATNVAFPGSTLAVGDWDYSFDNARWLAAGWIAPVPGDSNFPAGTDLAGTFWLNGETYRGNFAHGIPGVPDASCINLPGQEPCRNIAAHYLYSFAPDWRTAPINLVPTKLGSIPPIDTSACLSCGDESFVSGESEHDPAMVLSIDSATMNALGWVTGGAAVSINDALSPEVRRTLVDPALVWVDGSEPVSVTAETGGARAVAVRADGTAVVDQLFRFGARWFTTLIDPDGEVPAALSAGMQPASADAIAPRTGFVAAYSRFTDVTMVFGGTTPNGEPVQDVLRFWPGHPTGTATLAKPLPASLESATYSLRHSRAWLLGRVPVAKCGCKAHKKWGHCSHRPAKHWVVVRVDPVSGEVEGPFALPELFGSQRGWLKTTADGRIVVVAARKNTHMTLLLDAEAFIPEAGIQRLGMRFGIGRVASPPVVRYGRVSVGIAKRRHGRDVLHVRCIADTRRQPAMKCKP